MSAQNLRDLNLPEEQVRSTILFLEAYANTALTELNDLLGLDESGEVGNDQHLILTNDRAFSIAADTAAALRDLGQWLLYLDPERSRDALRRSGELFHALGQGFGMYLLVVAAGPKDEVRYDLFREPLTALTRRSKDEPLDVTWDSLRYPQQQAYLMLAAAGHPARGSDLADRLGEVLRTSMHREGVVPVGALSTPIRWLWDIAIHLYDKSPQSLQVISGHLAAMCRHYAETIELAQVNAHLWSHGAAPVDVGDIDIAGITAMAARQHGGDALLDALGEGGLLSDRDSIALAPVEAGLALAEPWRTETLKG